VLSDADRIVAHISTTVAAPIGTHRLRVSVWAKSTERTGSLQLIFNTAIRKRVVITDSVWQYYEAEDHLTTAQGDSLTVLLDAGTTYGGAQTLFDLCRLEVVR